jgi:structural maintenance of chromosomes protein 6
MENIGMTAKVLDMKKQALPDLESAYARAQERFNEAEKAREQKHKADDLKKELAWAHVAEKEHEMEAGFREVAKFERQLPKYQDAITKAMVSQIE